jgi:hypothetical protein
MSASEATAPVEASAQPTWWSPGDVSKNQLNKSPQGASDPRREFVQFQEKLGRVHEGNTGASRKSFRKKVERVVLDALGIRLGFAIPDRLRSRNGCEATAGLSSRSTLPGVGSRS